MREIKFRAWDKVKKQWETGIAMGMDGELITNHNEDYTLVQYTGLKDKNGKEIWDGDVDVCTDANGDIWRGAITWNMDSADYELINHQLGFQRAFGIIGDSHEVIGNIYENPELLTPHKENKV